MAEFAYLYDKIDKMVLFDNWQNISNKIESNDEYLKFSSHIDLDGNAIFQIVL